MQLTGTLKLRWQVVVTATGDHMTEVLLLNAFIN